MKSRTILSFDYFKFCQMRFLKCCCGVQRRKQRLSKLQRDLRRD